MTVGSISLVMEVGFLWEGNSIDVNYWVITVISSG